MVECVSELLRDLNELTRDFVPPNRYEDIAREEAETIEDIQQLENVQRAISDHAGYAETLISSAASIHQRLLERREGQTVSTYFSKMSLSEMNLEPFTATSDDASFHSANTGPLANSSISTQIPRQLWLLLSDQQKGRDHLRTINVSDKGRHQKPSYLSHELILTAVVITNIPLAVSERGILHAMEMVGPPIPLSLNYLKRDMEVPKHVAFVHFSHVKDAVRVILDMDHSILNPYQCELNVKHKVWSDGQLTLMTPQQKIYGTHRLAEMIKVNLMALENSLQTEQVIYEGTPAFKRIRSEIRKAVHTGGTGVTESIDDCFVTWAPLSPENRHQLVGSIGGPLNTLYESGIFHIRIKIPPGYLMAPPICWFTTKVYHLNIDEKGSICLDSLTSEWAIVCSISLTLTSIMALLSSPNFGDPVNLEAASFHNTNADSYEFKVKEWTSLYTSGDIIDPGYRSGGFVNTTT